MIMKLNQDGDLGRTSVFAIDWLEYRACINWIDYQVNQWIPKLERAKHTAAEYNEPVPMQIGKRVVLLNASGMGRGRQSHLEYSFVAGNIVFAFSKRKSESLRHSNLYVKLTGDACLQNGVTFCRSFVDEIIETLGGEIREDVVSRLDLCLDVVGLSLNDGLQQACENGQTMGSLLKSKKNIAFYGQPRTGIAVGNKKRIGLNLYDKRKETLAKGEVCTEAMMKHRWGGKLPVAASRIEYQISRQWLGELKGLSAVSDVLQRIPDIIDRLTSEAYPLFLVTDSVPDRENNNQSRCNLHADWKWIVEQMQALCGTPKEPLEKIQRGSLKLKTCYAFVRGHLTTAAAKLGMPCESLEDACAVLRRLEESCDGTEYEWGKRWKMKAIKEGTLEKLTSFDVSEFESSVGDAEQEYFSEGWS